MLALFQERLRGLISISLIAALAFLGVVVGNLSLQGESGTFDKEVTARQGSKAVLVASKGQARAIARKDSSPGTTNLIYSEGQRFSPWIAPEQVLVRKSDSRAFAEVDPASLHVRGPPAAAV